MNLCRVKSGAEQNLQTAPIAGKTVLDDILYIPEVAQQGNGSDHRVAIGQLKLVIVAIRSQAMVFV